MYVSVQVAFRCFYTGVHNKQLYPTFSRASGRAASHYANIFKALVDRFQLRKVVVLVNHRKQSAFEMAGYIAKAVDRMQTGTDIAIKSVKSKIDVFKYMREIKDENHEQGLYVLGCTAVNCYIVYIIFVANQHSSPMPSAIYRRQGTSAASVFRVRPSVTCRYHLETEDRPRRLLVHLNSEACASDLLKAAKDLRSSSDPSARSVYINPDLDPASAKLAYEKRERRRQLRRGQTTNDGTSSHSVNITTSTGITHTSDVNRLPQTNYSASADRSADSSFRKVTRSTCPPNPAGSADRLNSPFPNCSSASA